MATFVYRCPNTGLQVQGWVAEEIPDDEQDSFESVSCITCGRVTGRVRGDTKDQG
jgi:hypothetical protein